MAVILGDVRKRTARRRAVSTAYYAVFHALAYLCADELIGSDARVTQAWQRVYRGIGHGPAREVLKGADFKSNAHIRRIALAFEQLQDERNTADYDGSPYPHDRIKTNALIALARTTVHDIENLPHEETRLLASHLIVRARKRPRSQGE